MSERGQISFEKISHQKGVMHGCAVLLRLAHSSLFGVRLIGAHCFAHSRAPNFAGIKTQSAQYQRRPFSVYTWQSSRFFSADSSPKPLTLTVSANCARRIQLLQKQKAQAGSGDHEIRLFINRLLIFAVTDADLKLRLAVEGGGCSGLQFVSKHVLPPHFSHTRTGTNFLWI